MKTEKIVIRCSAIYKSEVRKIAEEKGLDMSSYIRYLIEKQKKEDQRNT